MPLVDLRTLLSELEHNEITSLDLSALEIMDYGAKSTLQTWRGHSATIRALALLPDGNLASSGDDTTIKFWNIQTGQCLREIKTWRVIFSLVALPESTLASGSDVYSNTVDIWHVADGKCLKTLKGHTCTIYSLTVLSDGNLASGAEDNQIKIWDVKSGACLKTLSGGQARDRDGIFYALLALPNQQILSGSRCGIKLWNIETGECTKHFKGHTSDVITLTLLPNNLLASGSHDGTIKIWNLETGECLKTLHHHCCVFSLAVLPDGNLVSGYQDRSIKVWDVTTGQCLNTLTGHSNPVSALMMLSDGRLASASEDSTIKIWSFPLRPLTFSDCNLLLEKLANNTSVEQLRLKGMALTQEDLLFLAEKIGAHKTLIELDLRQCQISLEIQQTLAKTFADHASLEILHLDIGTLNFKRPTVLWPVDKNNNVKPSPHHANQALSAEKNADNKVQQITSILANTPKEYFCPLTHQIFYSPVSLTVGSESYIYEQEAIEDWLKIHDTNPLTGEKIADKKTVSLTLLRNLISSYLAQYPLLWESDEAYFSTKLAEKFANAIVTPDIAAVKRYLALDPRLLSKPLKAETTALTLACEESSLEILAFILHRLKEKLNNSLSLKIDHSLSLLYSVTKNLQFPGVKLLNEALKWQDANYQHFLIQAVKDQRMDVIDYLLSLGVNPNLPCINGTSLLAYAVTEQLISLLEILIKHNVILTVQDDQGNNILQRAIIEHRESLALWLIENNKLPLNSQNKQGQSALHLAIEQNSTIVVKALLDNPHVDIHQLDNQGNTALHYAAAKGQHEIIHSLLVKGAYHKQVNFSQKTPFDIAITHGHRELAMRMKQLYQQRKLAFIIQPLEEKIVQQEKQLQDQQRQIAHQQNHQQEPINLIFWQERIEALERRNQQLETSMSHFFKQKNNKPPASYQLKQNILTLSGNLKLITSIPDNKLVTISAGGAPTIDMWQHNDHGLIKINSWKIPAFALMPSHTYATVAPINLFMLPNENILLAYSHGTLLLFNSKKGAFKELKFPEITTIYCLEPLQNYHVTIGSSYYRVFIVNLQTQKIVHIISTNNCVPNAIAVLSNGNLVTDAREKGLNLWETSKGQFIKAIVANKESVNMDIRCFKELPHHQLASGGYASNVIKIWDLTLGALLKILTDNSANTHENNQVPLYAFEAPKITCLQILQEGKYLLGGSSDGSIKIWDIEAGKCIKTLKEHTSAINSIIVLSDEKFISTSEDKTMKVWEHKAKGQDLIVVKEDLPQLKQAVFEEKLEEINAPKLESIVLKQEATINTQQNEINDLKKQLADVQKQLEELTLANNKSKMQYDEQNKNPPNNTNQNPFAFDFSSFKPK